MSISEIFQLAVQHHRAGHLKNAADLYQAILDVDRNNAEVLHNLGMISYLHKNNELAISMVKKAVSIKPNEPMFLDSLGRVFYSQQMLTEACKCFRQALAIKPDYDEACCNLGLALRSSGRLCESVEYLNKALILNPANIPAHNGLALTLHALGQVEEAMKLYREAVKLAPDFAPLYQNMLLAMNYSLQCSQQQIFDAHVDYANRHARTAHVITHSANPRDSDLKLRIGYVSPDFRAHSVACFIEPVLINHHHDQFEVFGYYNNHLSDDVTERLRQHVDCWRCIAGMPDSDVVNLIMADKIDILVDLAGHTENNRLPVFACKPAPLQITWMGYPATSGLSTMDYRITDGYADPTGLTEIFHTEALLRLPESFSCFLPPLETPGVGELPMLKNGYITFGAFNNLAKINVEVIALWAKILGEVPDSRLALKYAGLSDEPTRQMIQKAFSDRGVSSERLVLLGKDASQIDHLHRYNEIDIALDPFPYCGTTTTCDALWMGVPVITLSGNTHVSRVGVSQLSNLGLDELIATNKEQYCAIAKELSSDKERLAEIRTTLRQRMAASPLMDAPRFVDQLESAYRHIWKLWCNKPNY